MSVPSCSDELHLLAQAEAAEYLLKQHGDFSCGHPESAIFESVTIADTDAMCSALNIRHRDMQQVSCHIHLAHIQQVLAWMSGSCIESFNCKRLCQAAGVVQKKSHD